MPSLVEVTAPATNPVTDDEAKLHEKIDTDADDAVIAEMVTAATEAIQEHTFRQLVTATYDWKLDAFPASDRDALCVPKPPLQSVTSITYTATDGTSTVWSSSEYTVDTATQPGRIIPAYGYSWPATRDEINAVTIRFVCGYGDAADVPAALKVAIKELVGQMYVYRESGQPMTISSVPTQYHYLLAKYTMRGFR
jgi:uncharacterized phiE125 gp8 family phage protein